MKTIYKILLITIVFAVCSSFYLVPSPLVKSKGKLSLSFEHLVGNQSLVLNNQLYRNIQGEKFTVSKLNYYISNIQLKQANGKVWKQRQSYYLIKANEPKSQHITISRIPIGKYTEVSFMIGVDKKRNNSGIQSGALDPANGMFWTWNTGYVFLKLEGKVFQQVSNEHQKFMYHCGGFKTHNNIKQKTFILGKNQLDITHSKPASLRLKVDIQKVFSGKHTISIHKNTRLMSPARTAGIADNYQQTFTLIN